MISGTQEMNKGEIKMPTVREGVQDYLLKASERSLRRLKERREPRRQIVKQEKKLKDIKKGNYKLYGDLACLDLEFKKGEVVGGPSCEWCTFDDSVVFFPGRMLITQESRGYYNGTKPV